MTADDVNGQRAPPEDGVLELRIAEAVKRDIGRGIARIDPQDMARIGVKPGDVLQISGARKSIAKVMATFPEDREKGVVQIDGLTRHNAGVGLGEKLTLQPTDSKPAAKLELAISGGRLSGANDRQRRLIGQLLEGRCVTAGDQVRPNAMGPRSRDFSVLRTVPKGAVTIGSSTVIEIKPNAEARRLGRRIAYEDIGGLKRAMNSIREMIELPLRCPEVFEQLGIDPPKGILMHGPPGCGKTLIARAVANETDARFFTLSGPEVIHKHYGESEAHLRQVFEQAATAPSIIFLDEIDALAPRRAALGSEQQVERRVVSQLLTLMDGLDTRGQTVVIGATNLPESLDPALRRPGRFDREIFIGVPDRTGRQEILQIHSCGMPLADDVDLERLARVTHGFVGADLEALAREAAMARLRKLLPDIDFTLDGPPADILQSLTVGMRDFEQALTVVEPSAIREVFTEIPDVRWADVGGLDSVKQLLEETIQWPLRHPELFRAMRVPLPRGILLNGSPGVGKTLMAKALATESCVNFISVKASALMSKWVGESERAVREVFHKAKLAAPCIVFLDEVDGIAPRRSGSDATAVTDRVIAQLLTEMDGVAAMPGVIVLAATNRRDLIDPALLRAGRFDFVVDFPLPDAAARRQILDVHTRGRRLADDVDLDELAGTFSEGRSGADIDLLCRKASLAAIRELFAARTRLPSDPAELAIRRDHFLAALDG